MRGASCGTKCTLLTNEKALLLNRGLRKEGKGMLSCYMSSLLISLKPWSVSQRGFVVMAHIETKPIISNQ